METAQKIFSSHHYAKIYLLELDKIKNLNLKFKITSDDIWQKVIQTWDYNTSVKIIRDLFRTTEKYKKATLAENRYNELVQEWKNLKLGPIKWPCSQGMFDQYVQRVNNSDIENKDSIVKMAAIQYRRMKELNTLRNDFLELMIFEKHKNILPTLGHSKGIDYFINGISFDQKVAKSPTTEFMKSFGDKWKRTAIDNPELVAKYLYTYQDEGRFGADRRLLIVYLDDHIDLDEIEKIITEMDFTKPLKIRFEYNHEIGGIKQYEAECFVIVLSNESN